MNERRYQALVRIGCICCRINGTIDCGPTEIHHQNLGGHAGQRRLGDDYTIPLGTWHHRGDPPPTYTATTATGKWGPSMARNPKLFRKQFGKDDALLARTNGLIE